LSGAAVGAPRSVYNCGVTATPPRPEEPLLFERLLKEKVWGGHKLAARLGVEPPFAGPLGETWELSDYPGEETRVRGGRWAGSSLRSLMEAHADQLLGESRPTHDGRFPLLVKFIDAATDLSVQVHPPDGALSPTGVGKTEAWYVLDGEPGATVICGLAPGTEPGTFAAEAGDRRVEAHLHSLPVAPGDCVFVPAGMTHAIRGGVILCEVQQTSDVTYRMYDWDRVGLAGEPRETHLAEALRAVDYGLGPGVARRASFGAPADGAAVAPLAACPYFELQAVRVLAPTTHAAAGRARVLAVVAGNGRIGSLDGSFEPREIGFGDVVLLPGRLGPVRVLPGAAGLELLEGIAQ